MRTPLTRPLKSAGGAALKPLPKDQRHTERQPRQSPGGCGPRLPEGENTALHSLHVTASFTQQPCNLDLPPFIGPSLSVCCTRPHAGGRKSSPGAVQLMRGPQRTGRRRGRQIPLSAMKGNRCGWRGRLWGGATQRHTADRPASVSSPGDRTGAQ